MRELLSTHSLIILVPGKEDEQITNDFEENYYALSANRFV